MFWLHLSVKYSLRCIFHFYVCQWCERVWLSRHYALCFNVVSQGQISTVSRAGTATSDSQVTHLPGALHLKMSLFVERVSCQVGNPSSSSFPLCERAKKVFWRQVSNQISITVCAKMSFMTSDIIAFLYVYRQSRDILIVNSRVCNAEARDRNLILANS